jgi:inosine-uridine nucleoside N-ribohydrolase
MGGTSQGQGNASYGAEFNFHSDPEAAAAVLRSPDCVMTMVGWELCLQHKMTWEFYDTLVGLGECFFPQNVSVKSAVRALVSIHVISGFHENL